MKIVTLLVILVLAGNVLPAADDNIGHLPAPGRRHQPESLAGRGPRIPTRSPPISSKGWCASKRTPPPSSPAWPLPGASRKAASAGASPCAAACSSMTARPSTPSPSSIRSSSRLAKDSRPLYQRLEFPLLLHHRRPQQRPLFSVEITLDRPYAPFLIALADSAAFIQSPPSARQLRQFRPSAPGPFRFLSWSKGKSLILTRNPDYWGGAGHRGKDHLQGHARSRWAGCCRSRTAAPTWPASNRARNTRNCRAAATSPS